MQRLITRLFIAAFIAAPLMASAQDVGAPEAIAKKAETMATEATEAASAAAAEAMDSAEDAVDAVTPDEETATYAVFITNKGPFVAILEMEKMPITAGNFKGLAEGSKEWKDPKTGEMVKRPYYDGLSFHRVAPGFVIQGGDPLGTGGGGPGFTIKFETDPSLVHDRAGVLSMARTNHPDTAGSQFFVTLGDASFLDDAQAKKRGGRGYAAFGHVVEGLETVDALGKTPTPGGRDGKPMEKIFMKRVVIVEGTVADYQAKVEELMAAE